MNRAVLAEHFARLTGAGFPETAEDGSGNRFTGTVSGLRADFAASLYGLQSGYKLSLLLPWAERLPGKDDVLTLRGKSHVVIGVESFHDISVRLDLREGV